MSAMMLAGMILVSQSLVAAEYRVGIVPQYDVRELHAIWQPILDALSQEVGHTFVIVAAPTIPQFERQFKAGEFDFGYMNPYHAVEAHQVHGYEPVLRDVDKTLHGILVVSTDSPIQHVEQLVGKQVAFPAPNALGASLLIRADLERNFGVSVVPRYVKTHSSVYLNVVLGLTDAGGGVQRTLEHEAEGVRGRLRVLYKTQGVPSHPWVVHPKVPVHVKEQVVTAMINISKTEAGAAMLARVPIARLGAANISEYDVVAEMRLRRYSEGE